MDQAVRRVLRETFGYDAFRPHQEQVVNAILQRRDVLAVMPTGAGKSICYQLPALLLGGITLVISPLISLMQDQVKALLQSGVRAAWLNSTLTPRQQHLALERAAQGAYQIIYVAPERLALPAFQRFASHAPISLVTVDEAHCISHWGHDFRPSYLGIADFLASLPQRPPVAAFTATATGAVREDIARTLALRDPLTLVAGFDRPNLFFEVQEPRDRKQAVLETLARFPDRSGIVYCLTRKKVEELCEFLCEHGHAATRYHAGLSAEERQANQDDFLYDRKRIIVATNAFGMGIDKSNVSFVIHCGMPGDPESYYQEAGRAGRDGSPAQCILLYQRGDIQTNRFLLEHGREQAELSPEEGRELMRMDLARLRQMTAYCTSPGCLRQRLLGYFGEQAPDRCGNCANCLSGAAPEDVTTQARQVLLCVATLAREGRRLGVHAVMRILRGEEDPSIDWLRPERLDCYGALSRFPRQKLQRTIYALLDGGYLRQTEGDRPVLELTARAPSLAAGPARLTVKPSPARGEKRALTARGSGDSPLFSALREVRMQLARSAGVPAFMVFSDATLREMCRIMPRDEREFLLVRGVGAQKAARYGKAFLKCIRDWETEER